eukprot:7390364-Prymnesium_polylepis.2
MSPPKPITPAIPRSKRRARWARSQRVSMVGGSAGRAPRGKMLCVAAYRARRRAKSLSLLSNHGSLLGLDGSGDVRLHTALQ